MSSERNLNTEERAGDPITQTLANKLSSSSINSTTSTHPYVIIEIPSLQETGSPVKAVALDVPGLIAQAQSCYNEKKLDQTIKYNQDALNAEEALYPNIPTIYKAKILHDLGNIYISQRNYELAMAPLLQSSELLEKLYPRSQSLNKMVVFKNIGIGYYLLAQFPEAKEYLFKALDILNKLQPGLPGLDKVIIFNKIGEIYREEANYNQALQYFTDALSLYEALKNDQHILSKAIIFYNFGEVFRLKEDWKKAVEYYGNSKKIVQNFKLPPSFLTIAFLDTKILQFHQEIDDFFTNTCGISTKSALPTSVGEPTEGSSIAKEDIEKPKTEDKPTTSQEDTQATTVTSDKNIPHFYADEELEKMGILRKKADIQEWEGPYNIVKHYWHSLTKCWQDMDISFSEYKPSKMPPNRGITEIKQCLEILNIVDSSGVTPQVHVLFMDEEKELRSIFVLEAEEYLNKYQDNIETTTIGSSNYHS